jgi:hypothetical protein
MSAAGQGFDAAAHNIANLSTDAFSPLRSDGTQGPSGSSDLTGDMVEATVLAPVAYAANARMVRASDESYRALLDIRA